MRNSLFLLPFFNGLLLNGENDGRPPNKPGSIWLFGCAGVPCNCDDPCPMRCEENGGGAAAPIPMPESLRYSLRSGDPARTLGVPNPPICGCDENSNGGAICD